MGEQDCRGFSIYDEREVPVIAINALEGDYPPLIFTLIHEYCHLLLRAGGLSDENRSNVVEQYCNSFAASLLLPKAAFMAEAQFIAGSEPKDWTDEAIARLSRRFKVSKRAALLRLEETGMAPAGYHDKVLAEWKIQGRRRSIGGRGAKRAGKKLPRPRYRHTSTVLKALDLGYINVIDAHELLGVRTPHLNDLREELMAQSAVNGGAD